MVGLNLHEASSQGNESSVQYPPNQLVVLSFFFQLWAFPPFTMTPFLRLNPWSGSIVDNVSSDLLIIIL
jgi:hypothetical protein